jgi:hypothetical protein
MVYCCNNDFLGFVRVLFGKNPNKVLSGGCIGGMVFGFKRNYMLVYYIGIS